MIDIHSHILPAIDDGAETLEESLAMARLAVAGGVTDMVCSSHSAELFETGPQAALQERVNSLQAAVDAAAIPLRLWPGMEIFLTPETPRHLAAGRAWGLAGGRYVLVEVPYEPWPAYTEQTLFELQVAGYLPILAHPERYVAIQHDPNVLYRLVERGILAQVTTGAFDGHFGAATRRCAITLCEHGLVQILASDSHSAYDRRRLPGLSDGRRVLAGLVGKDQAAAMTTTIPGDVLAGRPITSEPRATEVVRPFLSRIFGGQSQG